MFRRVLLGLSLLVASLAITRGQDPCSNDGVERSCDICIQAHPDCVWCSYNPGSNSTSTMSIRRCYNRNTYDVASCPGGPSAVEDPLIEVVKTRDAELSTMSVVGVESVQVRPQSVNMTLRKGSPQSFNMSFITLRNTPLDVYFMLDVSASLVLTFTALQQNLQIIASSISDISSAYRIGIGGFIDKDVFPFGGTDDYFISFGPANPRVCRQANNTCQPPFGYRHYLSLTNDISKFQEVLDTAIELGINADSPEGGLDALMQMAVCTDVIGWRSGSLKMLFLITDNDFHIAGDGYLAGLVKPNDGKCHMEEIPGSPGQYDYAFSDVQDYPSIHQLLGALSDLNVVPTFAIQQSNINDPNLRTYQLLADEFTTLQSSAIGISSEGNTSSTAQAIIDLINRVYEATSQNIQVVIPSIDGYIISVDIQTCPNVTADGGCRVEFGDTISFSVTVELTDCELARTQTVGLRGTPYVFSDIVVSPSCDCQCSAEEFQIPLSENCNSYGTEMCSVCDCDPGRSGDFCECESETVGTCVDFNGEPCGGTTRGMCSSCGECMCIPPFFGPEQGCKCDNESCASTCEDNGVCVCGDTVSCDCTTVAPLSGKLFIGEDCSCNPDTVCFNRNVTNFPNLCQVLTDLSASGMCNEDCSGCDCSSAFTGVTNLRPSSPGLCLPELCPFYEPCVRCLLGDSTTCESPCKLHPMIREMAEDEELDASVYASLACQFNHTLDGCTYEFFYGRDNSFAVDVVVNPTPTTCPGLPMYAPFVIAAAAVLAIFLIGLLLICLLKICVVNWDKREFKKFTQELQHADFAPHENPLYLTPQQDYQNPILRRHSSKRKQ